MKPLLAILIALTSLPPLVVAEDRSENLLEDFVLGTYELIGKAPVHERTYSGRVEISRSEHGLKIDRIINGKRVKGTATIEKATADNIKILRIRFVEGNKQYEETCLIDSDLDNYARITCYLYETTKMTDKPGLEALFISSEK